VPWPYPNGSTPRIEIDHELRADPDEIVSEIPVCKHCSSQSLRNNGSYTSRRWNETRQAYICRDCHGTGYLPLGVWLARDEMVSPHGRSGPRKSRPVAICDCGSENLRPRGWRAHGGGRQQAQCLDCGLRFVLDAGVILPIPARNTDHEVHFALPSAAEEAAGLIRLFESGQCDIEEIRVLIRVSESERRCLEFLADAGMLAAHNVRRMLQFRENVLEIFNGLVVNETRDC
jgi:hypothetical protein